MANPCSANSTLLTRSRLCPHWLIGAQSLGDFLVIHGGCFVGEVMNQRPSDKCGGCVWWYEGPLLCEGCPNNPEPEAIKMPCSQCEKILFLDDICEVAFEEDRLHLLCSTGCKVKWEEPRTTKEVWGNHQ